MTRYRVTFAAVADRDEWPPMLVRFVDAESTADAVNDAQRSIGRTSPALIVTSCEPITRPLQSESTEATGGQR